MNAWYGFARSQVLHTGVELDLFTLMHEGWHTAEQLAQATSCTERGLGMVLNALAGLKLVAKQGKRYADTELARKFLSRKGARYLGGVVMHANKLRADWAHLTEVVRTGKPVTQLDDDEQAASFFVQFVDSLYNLNADAADAVAAKVLESSGKGLHVLDVAAGSAVWSLAFARRDPKTRITVLDLPEVLEKITKPFVRKHGAEDRVEFLPGSLRRLDFGQAKYDVIVLGHILHSEGEAGSKKLFEKAARALKPEGQLIVAEWIADEQRSDALFPLLFALNMLVHTPEGDTFTLSEYQQWLDEAGFQGVETIDAQAPSPIIVARKRAISAGRKAA
jgi:ubiquinone/menaquinone biosynthesis C-methylase UbiE